MSVAGDCRGMPIGAFWSSCHAEAGEVVGMLPDMLRAHPSRPWPVPSVTGMDVI